MLQGMCRFWSGMGLAHRAAVFLHESHAMAYSRENPSPRYRELLDLYRQMHRHGIPEEGRAPENTFPGGSLISFLPAIKALIEETGAKTLLDYGAGKALVYRASQIKVDGKRWPNVQKYWGVEQIYCYDPAYEPLSRLPTWSFDGVICTDVLEHCPEEDIPWILAEIFSFARRFVFLNIAAFPAEKCLPNGENAHCTVRPAGWWLEQIRAVAPQVLFEAVVSLKHYESGGVGYTHQVISNRGG